MNRHRPCLFLLVLTAFLVQAAAGPAWAAPSVEAALKLTPVQEEVQYELPAADQLDNCTIKAEQINGSTAWVVRGPSGDVLRQFSDSNSDNVVDTWSYFRDGVEVYRDIDADGDNKADQYRWFHSAGTRWGVDTNGDESLDTWRLISAEEVAEEAVAAIRDQDADRFKRLLPTAKEIARLGLVRQQAERLAERTESAETTFKKMIADGQLGSQCQFTDFGGLRPGLVPAGTNGSSKDLRVYENVWAMVFDGTEHRQLQLGTMVQLGAAWKLIDGPSLGDSGEVVTGFFFNAEGAGEAASVAVGSAPTDQMQEILADLEELDKKIATATADQRPSLNANRADLLERLSELANSAGEREQWLTQLADMVNFAVLDGSYPEGAQRLESLEAKLIEEGASDDMLAHLTFCRMQAEHGLASAAPDAKLAELQAAWLKQLEAFVDEYHDSPQVAEALLQLARESEFSGDDEAAVVWYRRIVEDYPNSTAKDQAAGAVVRLTSAGRSIDLRGTTVRGKSLDLSQYRGNAVIIQYWNTACRSCEADHTQMKSLYAKYGGRGLEIIGVNLDYSRDELLAYLKANRLPWPQLYEEGGFDGRLANEMGVVILPLLMLVDQQGLVVSHDLQVAELETELKKLLPSGQTQ